MSLRFKKYRKYLLIILCVQCLTLLEVLGQLDFKPLDIISLEDGLHDQIVEYLSVDLQGNLWISSVNSLTKYDGYSFQTIQLDTDFKLYKPKTIVDRQGMIWIIIRDLQHPTEGFESWDQEFYVYNPKTEKLMKLHHFLEDQIDSSEVIKLVQEFEDEIFVKCDSEDFIYSGSMKTLKRFRSDVQAEMFPIPGGYQLYVDSTDHYSIWDENGQLLTLEYLSDSLNAINFRTVQQKLLSVSNEDYEIHSVLDSSIRIKGPPIGFSKGNDLFHLKAIKIDSPFALYKKQLYRIQNGVYELFPELKDLEINDFDYVKGFLYLATNQGVFIYNLNQEIKFSTLAVEEITNSTRGIYANDQYTFYRSAGREKIRNELGKDISFDNRNVGLKNKVFHYYQDPQNENILWSILLYRQCSCRRIDLNKKKVDCYNIHHVNGIIRSSKSGKIYVGGKRFLLGEIDEENKKMTVLKWSKPKTTRPLEIHYFSEHKGSILMATSHGVYTMDEIHDTLKITALSSKLNEYNVRYLHSDRKDPKILWLATEKQGLIKYNQQTNQIVQWDLSNGLKSNAVHYIFQDEQDRLWLSTDRYLHCLNAARDQFYYFDEEDGISNNELNSFSHHYNALDSTLYLGSLNGYTYFNPNEIEIEPSTTELRILKIDIYNSSNERRTLLNVESDDEITLYEDETYIDIYLSADNLFNIENYDFYYQLIPANPKWIKHDSQILKLIKPAYGKYQLDVVGNKDEPLKVTLPFNLKIDVRRPFYKTVWFISVLILGLLLSIYAMIKYRTRAIMERNKELEKLIEQRTEKLKKSNETKSKLFAILSHDLRGPINNISLLSHQIKKLLSSEKYGLLESMAEQSSTQLVALNLHLKNILYWSINELGELDLQTQELNLNEELATVFNLYLNQLKSKNLNFNLHFDDEYSVVSDQRCLQLILRNLIQNAIKFSKTDSEINIDITKPTSKQLTLKIEDSGIGFTQSKLDNSYKGTGLGLAMCKDLAKKMKIGLKLEDAVPVGAVATLTFKT